MKNIRPIIEIVAEAIAFAVLLVMVFQTTKITEQNNLSRQAIEKMAEQNALSASSLARIDSTIRLMHEANELTRESNDLTRRSVEAELVKIQQEMKRTAIQETRLQEELRPRVVIKPFTTTDIKKDSLENFTLWITIENNGASDAAEVTVNNTIATRMRVLGPPAVYPIGSIPPKKTPQVLALDLPLPPSDLFILTEVSYEWVLPSGTAILYEGYKGCQIQYDSSASEYVRCMKLNEREIDAIFRKTD